MANLAIIPARGGSKRIPKKNIKAFLGKPVIAYSIEAALRSELFDEVMVSTDNEEISEIAIKYGAEVPFERSARNADDHATTIDVLMEVLNKYKTLGKQFDYGCCIYPTAPLTSERKLIEGFKKLKAGNFDTVFPIVSFSYPIWRGLRMNGHGLTEMVWPKYLECRSQDLEEVYHDAGQWYWFLPEIIKRERKLFTNNTATILLDPMEVQDIDTITDWKLAELKYKLIQDVQ